MQRKSGVSIVSAELVYHQVLQVKNIGYTRHSIRKNSFERVEYLGEVLGFFLFETAHWRQFMKLLFDR